MTLTDMETRRTKSQPSLSQLDCNRSVRQQQKKPSSSAMTTSSSVPSRTSSTGGSLVTMINTSWIALLVMGALTEAQTVSDTTRVSPWELLADPAGQWTQWGQWNGCVGSPCGQSVRNRRRHCHSETSQEGGSCSGPSVAYEMCLFNKRCMRSRIASQCRDHNTETTRYYPASSDQYSHCGQLECQEEHRGRNSTGGGGQFVRMVEKVVDGVACSTGRQCVNGQCKSMNCTFDRNELLSGCVNTGEDTLCTVLCGSTQPATAGHDLIALATPAVALTPAIALIIPECASKITVRMANKNPTGNIKVVLFDEESADLTFSDNVQLQATKMVSGMPIVYSKTARSLAAANGSILSAYFDQISIQGPLLQNISIHDEFGELGPLEYHYTLGDACGIPQPPRIEDDIPEEEGDFTSALVFQPFVRPTVRAPLDAQQQRLQSTWRNPVDPGEVPFLDQNGGVDQKLSWILLPFTHCSRSCGGGTKRASVICGSRQMRVFPPSYCSNSVRKPQDIVEPCNELRCPARWVTGPWKCSPSCRRNGTGVRTRKVVCRQVLETGVDDVVSQKFCLDRSPSAVSACRPAPCRPHWVRESWSKCNAPCGPGTKTRAVHCAEGSDRVNASLCAHLRRPNVVKNCSRRDCVRWHGGEWSDCNSRCASGYRFRDLVCMEVPRKGRSPRVRNDARCDDLPRLRTMERCGSDHVNCPIQYKWHSGPWSKCSSKCGSRGVRIREVHCSTDRRTNSTLGVVKYTTVDPVYCNSTLQHGPEPQSTEPCNRNVNCRGRWVKGRWSDCSVTCGYGKMKRPVTCQRTNLTTGLEEVTGDSDCDTSKRKPRSMQTCSSPQCPGSEQNSDRCTGDDKSYQSACRWAHERHVCHIHYFRQYCCATCSGVV